MRVALAQINTTVGDLSGNEKKILSFVKEAKKSSADIIVFPELAVTGYPPEDLLFKDHFVQDNINVVRSLTKSIKGITAIVGFVDSGKSRQLYNAAAVIAGNHVKGVYHKRELPNYGVFDEKRYFTEGRINPLLSFGGVTLGVNICEDIWTDKGIFAQQVSDQAKVLFNLSSSPYDYGKIEQRIRLLAGRAKQAGAFVCYTNLVGGQDELVFDGGSLIISPRGHILASGKQFEEDLVICDLKLKSEPAKGRQYITLPKARGKKKPRISRHVSRHLRPVERVYRALVLGTRDYIHKNGFSKVVIGISGGIDSSLVATIAREAVGKNNVIGISMPSRFTSLGTKSDAKQVAHNLGIRYVEVPIHNILASYSDVLSHVMPGQHHGLMEENLQARIRGNILMAFSNKYGWLVLTTGNKSEVAVGYCTLYGDMSGGFAVIKDVPKTQVYEIAKFINKKARNVIPKSVFKRPPTAELRYDQMDEDSLPPYHVLDPLLKAYIEEHQSFQDMLKINRRKEMVQKTIKLVDYSEYKRRQAPPGIKITSRAFGRDWRLPITNKYKEF